MKKNLRRKFPIVFLIIFVLFIFVVSTKAQGKSNLKKSKKISKFQTAVRKSKIRQKKFALKVFSAGVLNGRAIDLVKPEYPKTAKAVNAYGTVSVLVLIDETGGIVKAEAQNGHPFLRTAAVKAALQSKFEPIILSSDTPIKATGVIVYNFVAGQWNWLEIGYALSYDSNYYSIKILSETLPFDCEAERQLLNQTPIFDESRPQTIETIISLIRQRLANQPKFYWLFETGTALAKVRQNHPAKETFTQDFQNLKFLVQNPPPETNERLIERLQKIIFLIDEGKSNQIFDDLQKLEELFPYVGR